VSQNQPLREVCLRALTHNLALQPSESVAIVTDGSAGPIVDAFHSAATRLEAAVEIVRIPIAERNAEEPPAEAAAAMKRSNVVLALVARSISWTRARAAATEVGARVATMTCVTEEIIRRTLVADYEPIRDRVNRTCDALDDGAAVRLVTESGTDLRFSIDGRRAHGRKGGLYREPGHWGNLPCGEAFIAPVEGSGEGVYVVDASHAGVGYLERPIRITVRAGRAVRFEGPQADRLEQLLEQVGSTQAYAIAEFGIGCNHAARVTGTVLEDEKALGTCHVALGRNTGFGGSIDVGIHLDGVIRDPTIYVDGERLGIEI
jgi:leucyl aminopeptidase (aminopeptidase T)